MASKKKAAKRKRGGVKRFEIADHQVPLCEWLSLGKTLEDYCKQDGMPSTFTVRKWLLKDEEFFTAYTHARAIGGDAIAAGMLEIADEGDDEDVQHRRLQIDTRKWLLARWFPTNYGDRMKHEHDGNVNVTVVTGVPQPLEDIDP